MFNPWFNGRGGGGFKAPYQFCISRFQSLFSGRGGVNLFCQAKHSSLLFQSLFSGRGGVYSFDVSYSIFVDVFQSLV
jgi:hypothetical protein